MVSTPSGSPIDNLIKKNSQMAKSGASAARTLPFIVAKSKAALHYLLTRPRRMGQDGPSSRTSQNLEEHNGDSLVKEDGDTRKQRLLARLRYLRLAPRKYSKSEESPSTSKKKRSSVNKLENPKDDAGFVRPLVFECDFCTKVFFNKKLFRRHTIKHLSVRRCGNCNQPCATTIAQRRHQVHCKFR